MMICLFQIFQKKFVDSVMSESARSCSVVSRLSRTHSHTQSVTHTLSQSLTHSVSQCTCEGSRERWWAALQGHARWFYAVVQGIFIEATPRQHERRGDLCHRAGAWCRFSVLRSARRSMDLAENQEDWRWHFDHPSDRYTTRGNMQEWTNDISKQKLLTLMLAFYFNLFCFHKELFHDNDDFLENFKHFYDNMYQ